MDALYRLKGWRAATTPSPSATPRAHLIRALERDWPLSELGRRQVGQFAPVLQELEVDALASSPFIRAIDTLFSTRGRRRDFLIAVDEDLRE